LMSGAVAEWATRQRELTSAVKVLNARGLLHAAKWAAEQSASLVEARRAAEREGITLRAAQQFATSTSSAAWDGTGEDDLEDEEIFLLGKSYLDLKEYWRCVHVLQDALSPRAVFVRLYARYMAGEKRKGEEMMEGKGPARTDVVNEELPALEEELAELTAGASAFSGDPFLKYLYGVVLAERDRKAEARVALAQSLSAYPWNWSAWMSLQGLCQDMEVLETLSLPAHWMLEFFLASLNLELQMNAEGLERYEALLAAFPESKYIRGQRATAHYNLREFDEAEEIFEALLAEDPYRMEGMDNYSNILYVKECFSALSFVAHKAVLTDKYRPETCCIIGNYYSLKAHHEKAVEYFKRALKLNRQYLSAWTLMGHEYVEMKNVSAAVDAYRHAVDINPRDYRAWYGLGQTYEILAMPHYALYYYRRAAQLRPQDPRMWCAMGQCYENDHLDMKEAAIRCYNRAVENNDREGIALSKLAKLHANRGERDAAAHYHRLNLKRLDHEQGGEASPDLVYALSFLATHAKECGDLATAESLCSRLLDHSGPEKEDAKALLREIHSIRRSSAQPPPPIE